MSDYLSQIGEIKLEQYIGVETGLSQHGLNLGNLNPNNTSKLVGQLTLSRELIKILHEMHQKFHFNYITFINDLMPINALPLKSNAVRLENHLSKISSETVAKFKKLKVRKKYNYLRENVKVILLTDEVCTVRDIEIQERTRLERELNTRIYELYQEITNLQTRINKVQKKKQNFENLLSIYTKTNEELNSKIEFLTGRFINRGKQIGKCKKTQSKKKVCMLTERVEKALWFAKSFGVKFTAITAQDENGKTYDLISKQNSGFEKLPDEEKEKVKKLLFILDSFGISDGAYHELTLQNENMIKSYLIKQCRDEINSFCTISKTPGESPGAQLSVRDTINHLLLNLKDVDENGVVKLKFAADGAKMSRVSSFLVFSLALLGDNPIFSCHEQHTIGIVNASENYICISESFADIFSEMNDILGTGTNGEIEFECTNGKRFLLEFFLGGDMKFLLTALGLNAANAKYSCLYCKIEKSNRGDMSKEENFYSENLKRSLSEMKLLCRKKTNNFGCLHLPLVDIDLQHVVVDELHLLMRILDVLIRNLIEDSVRLDQKTNLGRKNAQCKNKNRNDLVQCFNNCGVHFQIWESRNKDGFGDSFKNLEWTSLTGSDMKKLLKLMPDSLMSVNCVRNKLKVIGLWQTFGKLYETMNDMYPSEEKISNFHQEAKSFVNEFISLGSELEGYDRKNITPYMHIMVYHVPFILKKYKSLKIFSGQGVEKLNDDIKMIYHRKSNKHDATVEAIRVRYRKRLLALKCSRIKRKYSKKDNKFWIGGGKIRVTQTLRAKQINPKV